MGRRAAVDTVVEVEVASDETNGDASAEPRAPLTSAQRVAAASTPSPSATEVADPFAAEAKYFTEIRALNRDVNNI